MLEALLRLLRRRWAVLATVFVGAVLAGLLGVRLWTPPYEGQAVLQVRTATAGSLENVSFDVFYTDRLLNTYAQLAESDQLHDELVSQLGGDDSVKLKAGVPANTELLVVEGSAPDPKMAADVTNALANRLSEDIRNDFGGRFDASREAIRLQVGAIDARVEVARQLPDGGGDVLDQLLTERDDLLRSSEEIALMGAASIGGVSIIRPAEIPTDRAINPMLLVALAGLLGLAGGFALALVLDRLDHRVYNVAHAVAERGYTVLGEVATGAAPLPAGADEDEAALDAAPLEPHTVGVAFRLRQASPRSLLFASAFARPATPLVVADVTRALASTGLDVVAIDAAWQPTLHAALDTVERPGLREALRHGKPLAELALPTRHSRVHLVPGGATNGDTTDAIETFSMLEELDSLSDVFDLVVVHASPLLERAEASLLGRNLDGIVLILEDGRLHEADLDEALEQVTALPTAFLGVIVARPGRPTRRFPFRGRDTQGP